MPQVNISVTPEEYELLVVEAANRQSVSKKVVKISSLAAELLKPAIHALNGNVPAKDANPKEIPESNSKEADPFADFDIG